MYAKIVNSQVAKYPYSFSSLRDDNPNVSFPLVPSDELLAEYGMIPITKTARPSATLTQDPVEQIPQLVNGVWTQVWQMVNVSAEVAARRQQVQDDVTHANAIKADAFVKNFVSMTPVQVSAYVTNNTANLAAVRALLEKMALMMLALAKNEYRE